MVLRVTFRVIALACAVLICGLARADDINDPPWDLSEPNQTSQEWDCPTWAGIEGILPDTTFPTGLEIPPTYDGNDPGNPFLRFTQSMTVQEVPGPDGTDILTWHVDATGPVEIVIPNWPPANPVKYVFWQITSDKSPADAARPASSNPPGTNLPAPYPHVQHQGTWYTYNGLMAIQPNPPEETIIFEMLESTNISQIVVDTICTVPEPSTFALAAMGLLGLAWMCRRRR